MQQPVTKSSGIKDALSDVFHGSLLEKIPARSLIIMSMVSKKLKELVDTASKKLDLWWVKNASPSPTATCLNIFKQRWRCCRSECLDRVLHTCLVVV
jgi:hypothetical protein